MNIQFSFFLKPVVVTLFLLSIIITSIQAGEIDSRLEAMMAQGNTDDIYSTIVILKDQVDLNALKASFQQTGVDRRTRHEIVVNNLREKAEETQPDLINLLSATMGKGVVSYRSFWILNAIAVNGNAEFLTELANQQAVEKIYRNEPVEIIQSVGPIIKSDPINVTHIAEQGILDLNVRPLWNMGITGDGVIVMNIDTGVASNHPALSTRWRGADPGVDTSEAWFDPVNNFPIPYDNSGHGTHTMGTITGLEEDADPDTIGVAWGAKWIAALLAVNLDFDFLDVIPAIEAFQWGIDPDSIPETIDDVPRVISNSWGIPLSVDCNSYIDNIIDAVEAAGVAVLFAAGNNGPELNTMISPGSRIASPINVFSVGALEPGSEIVAGFSSRGPSGCDDLTIKPEVMARGVSVRSAIAASGYGLGSGTSMATPHVAGVIALLGQAFPEATVDELKYAIYETTVDLGVKGEDNNYGNGRVDAYAAYLYLKYGYIDEFNLSKSYVRPGIDSVEVTARLIYNTSGFKVSAEFITSSDSLVDKIELYDDGLHNDGMAGDSIFGNIWAVLSNEERNYRVDLEFQVSSADTDTIIFSQKNQGNFTSIGPVVYDGQDSISVNNNQYIFKVMLANNGSVTTANAIRAKISTSDTCATSYKTSEVFYRDIAAGGNATPLFKFTVDINSICASTEELLIPFDIEISSERNVYWTDSFVLVVPPGIGIGVEDEITGLPAEYALSNAYPNPFNPTTTIEYSLPQSGDVSLIIYNLTGQEVTRLVSEVQQAGYHKVTWNASNISSGIYFYRLQASPTSVWRAGDFVLTRKMVLLK